ncbi:MAG: hypothetical protein ACKPKO_22940 [Candidatus Fonsibacter sp.]
MPLTTRIDLDLVYKWSTVGLHLVYMSSIPQVSSFSIGISFCTV